MRTRPIIGVLGSGTEAHERRSRALGQWLALQGVHLLTGGGRGVMSSVSQAFFETPGRSGSVIGVLPGEDSAAGYIAKAGYPNPWVEIPIVTHLPLSGERGTDPMSRNHINVLTSDLLIALPGSAGTASEVRLALHYQKPIIAYLDSAEQIEDLPSGVRIEPNLEKVKAFVLSHVRGARDL